ncbi:ribosomal RNA small subunit methyltransferase H, partial [Arthrobacter sp. Hiyo6]
MGIWLKKHPRLNAARKDNGMSDPNQSKPTSERHVPVLKDRCINLLAPGIEAARKRGETPVVIDATLGMGGHSETLLQRFPDLHLIGIDRDEEALALAGERLKPFAGRTDLVHAVYDEIPEVLEDLGLTEVHGVLMDLGVSSLQLDERERGFAYSFDAPLDMRMDTSRGQTAADVVNSYSEEDLVRIIRKWGEEKFAGRIANRIVADRAAKPFTTTGELVETIRAVVPAGAAKTGGHPAKRTFQALRIEVNEELDVLERAVPAAVAALAMGGRVVVMSYHSLEDKIVKKVFQAGSKSSAPLGFPVELEEHKPELKTLTKAPRCPPPKKSPRTPAQRPPACALLNESEPGGPHEHRSCQELPRCVRDVGPRLTGPKPGSGSDR